MLTLLAFVLAFVLALGLLIAVHEYGHYRVAVACGVSVLRFGVGTLPLTPPVNGQQGWLYRLVYRLSAPVYEWQPKRQREGQATLFSVGLFPFGGYVQMLDEREHDNLSASQLHRAFNRKSLKARAAIVAAGPIANLLLAVVLYASVYWIGESQPRAMLSTPSAGSLAQRAGLRSGDEVMQAAMQGGDWQPITSMDSLRWLLLQAALDKKNLQLEVLSSGKLRQVELVLSEVKSADADAGLYREIGILSPWASPVIQQVIPGGVAHIAGLQAGDLVRFVDKVVIDDASQLRELIRQSVATGQAVVSKWQVQRSGHLLDIELQPQPHVEQGQTVGRIGAYIGQPAEQTVVRYGLLEGLSQALVKTWHVSELSLSMLGKILTGQASIKHLSGPFTVADYAGKAAHVGWTAYLGFLALISVSLGVLNLLPLPVLDGGHLMYYLWEGITGKSVSQVWAQRLQRFGVAVLMALMMVALYNDIARLLG